MRKVLTSDVDLATALIAQIHDIDIRYPRAELELKDNDDILLIRRSLVEVVKNWFSTVDQWKTAEIEEF